MVVVVDKDAYDAKDPAEMTVEKALTDTVQGGKIGLLSVDPKSLDLRAPGITHYTISLFSRENNKLLNCSGKTILFFTYNATGAA